MNPLSESPQLTLRYHQSHPDWLLTPQNEPRGYIQPKQLKELWFHTGTICNLSCHFCLEGSKPGDDRLNKVTLKDIIPFVKEAIDLGVEKFCFTGGEPFVIPEMIDILSFVLNDRPSLVLTNGTHPLKRRWKDLLSLKDKPHPLNLRVSLDYPDPVRHDLARGSGNFALALESLAELHKMGFPVSVARQKEKNENTREVDRAYRPFFRKMNLPDDLKMISFPDFLPPGSLASVPHITEDCMTTYHTQDTRDKFMCTYSKMVVKRNGQMRVYACTLVDDDEDYDLGGTLKESMSVRIMLKHHRCYSCFACGASCSES